jgi:hypothetical protein
MQGFTPSVANQIGALPYGTSDRKVSNLQPATDYYYCVRVVDEYGAVSDACSVQPCTTKMAPPPPDMAVVPDKAVNPDLVMSADIAMNPDIAMDSDLAMNPDTPDIAMYPDLSIPMDLSFAPDQSASGDLAMSVDLGMAGPNDSDMGGGQRGIPDGFEPDGGLGRTGGKDIGGCSIARKRRGRPDNAALAIAPLLFALALLRRRRRS